MLEELCIIKSVQWYYENQGEYGIFIFHDGHIGIDKEPDTKATIQQVPMSRYDYPYTHGGSEYRKAVNAVWDLFPDYLKD